MLFILLYLIYFVVCKMIDLFSIPYITQECLCFLAVFCKKIDTRCSCCNYKNNAILVTWETYTYSLSHRKETHHFFNYLLYFSGSASRTRSHILWTFPSKRLLIFHLRNLSSVLNDEKMGSAETSTELENSNTNSLTVFINGIFWDNDHWGVIKPILTK